MSITSDQQLSLFPEETDLQTDEIECPCPFVAEHPDPAGLCAGCPF